MKRLILPVSLLVFSYGCISSTAEEKKEPVQTQESVTPPEQQVEPPVIQEATAPAPQTTVTATSALPSAMIMDANNQTLNLSAYKGKKVFVNLWATWCGPCRAEIPSIERLAAKADKKKVAFVMLSLDDNFDKARAYARNNNMKLPIFYPAGELPALFNVEGIPTTFIFDENGVIIHQQTGSSDFDTNEFLTMLTK